MVSYQQCCLNNQQNDDWIWTKIFVQNPLLTSGLYTTYAIVIETNNPCFCLKQSVIRRRYSEFVILHALLEKQHQTIKPPSLPGKFLFRNRFSASFIEKRRAGLEDFLQNVCKTQIFLSNKAVHLFIQSKSSMDEIKRMIKGGTNDLSIPFDDVTVEDSRSRECDDASVGKYTESNISANSMDENGHHEANTAISSPSKNVSSSLLNQSDNPSASYSGPTSVKKDNVVRVALWYQRQAGKPKVLDLILHGWQCMHFPCSRKGTTALASGGNQP